MQGKHTQSDKDVRNETRALTKCASKSRGHNTTAERRDHTYVNDRDTHEVLYSELQAAIYSLNKNKSPESDGITAELLPAGWEQLTRQMHTLCNKAWQEGTIPDDWGKSLLVPPPKKGDLSNCSNYRTISLINHT